MEELQAILVTRVSKDRFCITLRWSGAKHRYYNGDIIGIEGKPNLLPPKERATAFNHLKRQFVNALQRGWSPDQNWSISKKERHANPLRKALEAKLQSDYSHHYKKKLKWLVNNLEPFLKGKKLSPELVSEYLNQPRWSPAMRNNLRSHFLSLETELKKFGYQGSVASFVKRQRINEHLHKPIHDVLALLNEIENFDTHLHLCCLLAFGCLLRPHREIRLLTWGDFNQDLTIVALSGSQTKGKRNRIVPVAKFIRIHLFALRPNDWKRSENIFTHSEKPFAVGYFNCQWTRFKKVSKLLEKDQTLYSFRHSGAIQVYEKTGSLTKLQQVMGHSSLQVSLTYLRGLEVRQLDQNDMPTFD
jgi:integrase